MEVFFFFFTRVFFEQISDVIFSTVNHAALLDGGLLFCCLLGWFFLFLKTCW